MPLAVADIQKLAQLARLELTEAEAEQLLPRFAEIVSFVDQLQQLPTEGVEPTTTALEVVNRLADDEPRPGLSRDQALAAAPASDGECFLVPPVLGP